MTEKSVLKWEYQSADTIAIKDYLSENQERLDKVSRWFANRVIAQLNSEVWNIRISTNNEIEQNYLSCIENVTNDINLSFIYTDSEIKNIIDGKTVLPQMIPFKIKASLDKFTNKCKTWLNRIKLLWEVPAELENNITEMNKVLSSYSR